MFDSKITDALYADMPAQIAAMEESENLILELQHLQHEVERLNYELDRLIYKAERK